MIGVVGSSELAAGYESLIDGGSPALLGRQALAAAAVLAYSFVLTFVLAHVVRLVLGLRVSEQDELTGIDQTVHAETAYELSGGLGTGGPAGAGAPVVPAARERV